jgi:LmeA-like phospholipid-binding
VNVYPNQPRQQDGWPAQPPRYSARPGDRADPYGPGTARYSGPRRRRRGRGWIALLVTLVVLAVLFAVGDQVARAYAQNMIASRIESSSGLAQKPSVTIQGFPFLTQLAAHDLRVVDVSASNVQAGKVDITSIKATATGVHLNAGFSSAKVDQINGTALISFASLENALGVQGVATISADPADGPNAVKLSAGIVGTITGKVEVTGPNQVTVQMGSLSGLASLLGGTAPIPTQTIQIPKLPAGLVVRSVSVTDQGVVATASAQDTTLSQ